MWTVKDEEKLKIAMVKRFGRIDYTKLAKELGTTRQTIYNVRTNFSKSTDKEQLVKNWLNQK